MKDDVKRLWAAALVLALLSACAAQATQTPEQASALILCNWGGDISQEILDAFEDEYGIPVTYLPYESQEEAVDQIRSGEAYDVVVLENQLIPALVDEGLLAEIDYRNVPNFKNISANFRDLAYDPQNMHAIPYSWGTTGLVVRADLLAHPVTRWSDLWRPRYAGQLMGWPLSRYMIGIALKSLGYSLNSEDPAELEDALTHLIALKPHIILRHIRDDARLVDAKVIVASADAVLAQSLDIDADLTLLKPVSFSQLRDLAKRLG